MTNRMVTASIPMRRKQDPPQIDSISIKRVDNGFTACAYPEGGPMSVGYDKPEEKVFTNGEDLIDYVQQALGIPASEPDGDMDDGGGLTY